MNRVITLLTDFGVEDGYVAVMKGVVLSIYSEASLVDISHSIGPQNVLEAALTLARVEPYFPTGTIFLSVVDPGVGTHRRAIAAKIGHSFFVGPDNGLISLLVYKARREGQEVRCYLLNKPEYWLPKVSRVFHGRDIFAPVAAHLARGVPIENLGDPFSDPVMFPIPVPEVSDFGWICQVIHIDHFGNLAINLMEEHLAGMGPVRVVVGEKVINGLVEAYGYGKPGELVALFDSAGYLSIGLVNGSAQAVLNARLGDIVEIYCLRDD